MKLEILELADLQENVNHMDVFEAPNYVSANISHMAPIKGIVIVDGKRLCKFYFSPRGMDGNVYSDDVPLKTFVKRLIPIYLHFKPFDPDLIE